MISYLFQDWKANKSNIKGRLVLITFQTRTTMPKSTQTSYAHSHPLPHFLPRRI